MKIVNKSLEVVFFVDFFEFDVGSDAAVDYCAESIIGGDLVELDLLVFWGFVAELFGTDESTVILKGFYSVDQNFPESSNCCDFFNNVVLIAIGHSSCDWHDEHFKTDEGVLR